MRWLLAVALVTVTLAGCAAEDAPPAGGGDPGPPGPIPVLDDALAAWKAGNESANLDLLGRFEQSGEEADSWEDLLFIDSGSTVHILRTTEINGSLEFEAVGKHTGTGVKDVKVSDDGQWMFLGNDEQASNAPLGGNGRSGGFYVVDISDKAAPKQVSYLPVGPTRGPHMVFYHQQADGTELVFGANGDVSINEFDRDSGTLTERARYAPDYATDVNRDPHVIDAYYQLYAHDMFVMEDTGPEASVAPGDSDADRSTASAPKTMMYVANWDAGLRVVDVTDPAAPAELGAWNDFPEGHSGNLHTVSTEWIGDRRITVGSVEVGFAVVGGIPYALDEEKSVLYVWDTTDPSEIRLLGQWENPDGLSAGRSDLGEDLYSTHNLQLEGGLVYLAHYELGIWVLDVRTPARQVEPMAIAYYGEPGDHVWDVVVSQGRVYGSGAGGIVGLGFPLLESGSTSRA